MGDLKRKYNLSDHILVFMEPNIMEKSSPKTFCDGLRWYQFVLNQFNALRLSICLQSACWAMTKSWLDVQVDLELTRSHGKMDLSNSMMDTVDGSPGQSDRTFQASDGPESWPLPVLSQQPRQISVLLQKLHSGYEYIIMLLHMSDVMFKV